jgi:hypothetical protein
LLAVPARLRLTPPDKEPDRLRAGHRLAVPHHRDDIPAIGGIPGVPGSHHAQFTGVLHRSHASAGDRVRTNKTPGLRNLTSKTWTVNCGWVLAANIAADLSAWCRLPGLYDCDDLKDAEPDTLRYGTCPPGWSARPS